MEDTRQDGFMGVVGQLLNVFILLVLPTFNNHQNVANNFIIHGEIHYCGQ